MISTERTYYSGICAIVKDENLYLEEWVTYHLALGFEHIIIYDNSSDIPVRATLRDFISKKTVTVIDHPDRVDPQLKVYNQCLDRFGSSMKWLAFIDIDEFITLHQHACIGDFLNNYEQYGGVCLNWLVFGANGHIDKPAGGVLTQYTKSAPRSEPMNRRIKSIVQPAKIEKMDSVYMAKCKIGHILVNEKRIQVMTDEIDFSNDHAFIRHYLTRSYEEWVEKLNRGRGFKSHTKKPEHFFWLCNPDLLPIKTKIQTAYFDRIADYLTFNDHNFIKRRKWRPVANEAQKVEINRYLMIAAECVAYGYSNEVLSQGLFHGRSGMAIFLFHYFRYTKDPNFEDQGFKLLNIDFDAIGFDRSVSNGFRGIVWAIEHLSQNLFIDCYTNRFFGAADQAFSEIIDDCEDLSLADGLIGYGQYFLSRMSSISYSSSYEYNRENGLANLSMIIKKLSEILNDDRIYEASGKEGLKTLEGRLTAIEFLLNVVDLNIEQETVLKLLTKLIDEFISSVVTKQRQKRTGEDYDADHHMMYLTASHLLLMSANLLKRSSWELFAHTLLLHTLDMPKDHYSLNQIIEYIRIYNRLYQEEPEPILLIILRSYIDRLLILLDSDDCELKVGIVGGWAGAGLTLLSLITETEPEWDKMIMYSKHHQHHDHFATTN